MVRVVPKRPFTTLWIVLAYLVIQTSACASSIEVYVTPLAYEDSIDYAIAHALQNTGRWQGGLTIRVNGQTEKYEYLIDTPQHIILSKPGTSIEIIGDTYYSVGRQTRVQTDRDTIEHFLHIRLDWLTLHSLWPWLSQRYTSYAGSFLDDRIYIHSSMDRHGRYPVYMEADIVRGIPVFLEIADPEFGEVTLMWTSGTP